MLMAYFLASRHEVETAMTGTDALIIVTGTAELPVTVDAIRHGAFGYVPKPFDLRYLDHLIAASLGR